VTKRAFDCIVAAAGLLCLSPILLMVAVLIKLDSKGPILFRQERIGKGFSRFRINKFRTMVVDAPQLGSPITFGEDPRITRVGRLLRKTKVDELPQLVNVLRGEMSIVGPRPEVPTYVNRFRPQYERILKVRPGITDPASLRFQDEAAILGKYSNPEEAYVTSVLPDKLRIGEEYLRGSSLLSDLGVILRTVAALFGRRVSS
jgi:lipopolysaccharide/colanic/teichoic acid biosynthesis glycosyltransferase